MRPALVLTALAALALAGIALAGDCQAPRQQGYARQYAPAYAPASHSAYHEDEASYFTFFAFTGPPSSALPPVTISQGAFAAEQQKVVAAQQESSGVSAELRALREEVASLKARAAPLAPDLPPPVPVPGYAAAEFTDLPPKAPAARNNDTRPNPAPRTPLATAAGIFSLRCAECHTGAAARGPKKRGPVQLFNDAGTFELKGTTRAAVRDEIADRTMPKEPRPPLTDAERDALLAWLAEK